MATGIGIDLTVVDSGRESDKRGTQRHDLLQKIIYLFIIHLSSGFYSYCLWVYGSGFRPCTSTSMNNALGGEGNSFKKEKHHSEDRMSPVLAPFYWYKSLISIDSIVFYERE